jgi:thymidylate kinase
MLLLGVHRHYLKTLIRIEAALADISSMKREANWGGVLLIDQGPLSSLAYLHYKGVSNRWIAKWMNYLQRKAVIILDKAFWLDAPNAVLIERLRKRKSGHIMEQFPDTKVNQFYNFYRIFYGKVLQDVNYELINTERLSIRDVSARIESEFALVTNSHEGEDICGA